jgi:hypothetical protein
LSLDLPIEVGIGTPNLESIDPKTLAAAPVKKITTVNYETKYDKHTNTLSPCSPILTDSKALSPPALLIDS